MFVTLLVTLFFSVRGSNADSGALVGGRTVCRFDFCITLNEGEIKAEAGLCAVIPCSFTIPVHSTIQSLVWYKCEPSKYRCTDSNIILHTKNNRKVQSEFGGRVSLLEPDAYQNNCSIIVNDLTESDSGSYQLRVNRGRDGFTFEPRATVSVKDLTQKPTVMVPPLTAEQQTTLTCTAPGLCSGSKPEITWMWRGAGGKHITGTIPDYKTESLTSVTQRHSSTLTFNPSAEHHGTKVTCKVSFINNISTEETVTLNVTYVKEIKISGTTSIKESETLKLTCSLESFPPSLITWSKYFDKNIQTGLENILHNDSGTILHEESGRSTLTVSNVTEENSGRYICRAKHLDNTLMEKVDIKVKYIKKLVITGKTSVEEGHALNLTCSVQSFPPSRITWTKLGSNTNLHSQPDIMSNNMKSATLVIRNVTREDSGRYICTAEHLNKNVTVFANITVMYFDEPVTTGKTSVEEGHALNLTCSVQSFPPSRITWTKHGSNTNLHSQPDTNMSNNSDSATLFIQNVTRDNSGRFICTAEHLNTTMSVFSDITVMWFPKILQNSKCKVQLNILTCVCITEGFPLPTIKWPLLKNHTEYSVMTTVSDHTIKSTITLTVKDQSSTAVECVSASENGEATESLIIQTDTSDEKDKFREVLQTVSWLELIIAFLTGVLLSAVICCFISYCHRKKQKSFENPDATMEMIDGSQAVEQEGEKAALDLNGGPEDLHYASIDFSLLRRKSPREEAKMPEKTETEYAEIKREVKEKEEDNSRDEGEILDVQEEETKHGVSEEEKEEDMAVYSNVKDVMSEI